MGPWIRPQNTQVQTCKWTMHGFYPTTDSSTGCKGDHGFYPTIDTSARCKWDHRRHCTSIDLVTFLTIVVFAPLQLHVRRLKLL